jgi:hypothetical protein
MAPMLTESGIPLEILATLSGGLVVLAIVVAVRSRKRRVGDQPHCRKCDYLLIGIVSERCPECGSELSPKSVVRGELKKRLAFRLTVTVILLSAAALVPTIWRGVNDRTANINWYAWHSTSSVLNDLRTGSGKPKPNIGERLEYPGSGHGWVEEDVDLARVALDELIRREENGNLPVSYRNQIIAIALSTLSKRPTTPVDYHLREYLSQAEDAGNLSAEQKAAFFDSMTVMTFSVRPRVSFGADVPLQITVAESPLSRQHWAGFLTGHEVDIDDRAAAVYPPVPEYPLGTAVYGGIELKGAIVCYLRGAIGSFAPGHHVAQLKATIEIKHGPIYGSSNQVNETPASCTKELSLKAELDVLPAGAPSDVTPRKAPDFELQICSAMQPERFEFNIWNPGGMMGFIKTTQLPVNVTFKVFASYSGHEYPIGEMAQSASASEGEYRFDSEWKKALPNPGKTIDLVLRSSVPVAQSTLNLYEIWDGQIILRNVPIIDGNASGQRWPKER